MKFSKLSTTSRYGRASAGRRKMGPMVESLEGRQLLTGGTSSALGFLTGSVLLDGTSGSPVKGVTIELYKSGCNTPVATQCTNANGQYLFSGLAVGDYSLKEIAPKGYTANGVDANSQLYPTSEVGNDTINVSVVDPSQVFVNYGGIETGSYGAFNVVVNGKAQANSAGGMSDTLGTSAGATDLSGTFQTFCVNDQQSLSFGGGEQYQVVPKPVSQLSNGRGTVSADAAGQIAYLFNHYGNSSLSNVQGAGLQLAVWELLYDNGANPDLTSGNFQVTSPYTAGDANYDASIAQAKAYLSESAGKSETAMFLDAAATSPCDPTGRQSVLVTESLNFSVHANPCTPTPTPCPPTPCPTPTPAPCPTTPSAPTNVQYVINGCATYSQLGGHVHAGDTVQVVFCVPAGQTQTLSLVSYKADSSFNLANQTVYCSQTQTFGSGKHSLTVKVPSSYFQVDFVSGSVITKFNPSAGVTYHGQNRFIDADQGAASGCNFQGSSNWGSICSILPTCGWTSSWSWAGSTSCGTNSGQSVWNFGGSSCVNVTSILSSLLKGWGTSCDTSGKVSFCQV